jgi:hypothetical protein
MNESQIPEQIRNQRAPKEFSVVCATILINGGWFPNRNKDRDFMIQYWKSYNLNIFNSGVHFAESFSGLFLRYPLLHGFFGYIDLFTDKSAFFDPKEDCIIYGNILDVDLLPIGFNELGASIYYLSDGRIFWAGDEGCYCFHDQYDFFESLLVRGVAMWNTDRKIDIRSIIASE